MVSTTERGAEGMTKAEIIEGLQQTEELLKAELPVLKAWEAIKAIKEALLFVKGQEARA